MSRRRYISTDISTDADVAGLASASGVLSVLLYTWAIPHADDWGRLTGDAVQFRLAVCPGLDVTVRQVDEALEQVAAAGLWQRYEVDGRKCIAFPRQAFNRHQSYIPKEKREQEGQGASAFPPPPPQNAEKHRVTPQNPASPSPSPSPSPSGIPFASLTDDRPEPPVVALAPVDVGQEAQGLATAAYDALKAAGRRPSDQRWVGRAIGRIKQLTPEARAELPQAISWALQPGCPSYIAAWLSKCEFGQVFDAYGLRMTQPSRASPSPSEPRGFAGIREFDAMMRAGGGGP